MGKKIEVKIGGRVVVSRPRLEDILTMEENCNASCFDIIGRFQSGSFRHRDVIEVLFMACAYTRVWSKKDIASAVHEDGILTYVESAVEVLGDVVTKGMLTDEDTGGVEGGSAEPTPIPQEISQEGSGSL